jgi:hypothetical protein
MDGNLVEKRQAVVAIVLAPPIRILLERHVIVFDRLGQHEWAGASFEGFAREILTTRFDSLARQHHAGPIDEQRQQR